MTQVRDSLGAICHPFASLNFNVVWGAPTFRAHFEAELVQVFYDGSDLQDACVGDFGVSSLTFSLFGSYKIDYLVCVICSDCTKRGQPIRLRTSRPLLYLLLIGLSIQRAAILCAD